MNTYAKSLKLVKKGWQTQPGSCVCRQVPIRINDKELSHKISSQRWKQDQNVGYKD